MKVDQVRGRSGESRSDEGRSGEGRLGKGRSGDGKFLKCRELQTFISTWSPDIHIVN